MLTPPNYYITLAHRPLTSSRLYRRGGESKPSPWAITPHVSLIVFSWKLEVSESSGPAILLRSSVSGTGEDCGSHTTDRNDGAAKERVKLGEVAGAYSR